ncbi:MAG: Tn3 family transposase [Pseudomonadales bacterium]
MLKQSDKRRYILSQSEINELYCLPRLNKVQQEQCFSLTDEELSAVNQQSLLGSKIHFILLLGYFREKPVVARFRFRDVQDDSKYVIDRYYPGQRLPRKDLSQSQVYYLRNKLFDMLHYRNPDSEIKSNLEVFLADVATICAEPRYLFDECLAFFTRERITLPRYTMIQDLVSRVLTAEDRCVETILTNSLQKKTKQHLADLLSSSDSITRLGRLKRPAKDFSISEINREVESHRELIDIYHQAKRVIKKLDLSPRNLEYYCGLVNYYSVTKLRRFSQEKAFLYLLCYIHFRYQKIKRVFYELFVIDANVKNGESFIKLKKAINHNLIIGEWDQIRRIICSLARKKITQSTLIKKLSTLSKSNKTLAALREYDRLVKATYLLSYLDDQDLRRFVQQALNKGEAYHQLRRKVASVNGEKFRGGSDSQVELWNDCARLISNCIIYYNSAILSNLLARVEKKGDTRGKEILCRLSPVAWQRINLNGVYEFEGHERIELDQLLKGVSTDSSQLIDV